MNGQPLVVVWFAGGGGSSIGISEAFGQEPDFALNHNLTALDMHEVNHPRTVHLCEDAHAPDPATLGDGQPVDLFWASPDCTHHSKARGGAPVSERIRGLCWVVTRSAGWPPCPTAPSAWGRKGRSVELNPGYWADGVRHCQAREGKVAAPTLFALPEDQDSADEVAA